MLEALPPRSYYPAFSKKVKNAKSDREVAYLLLCLFLRSLFLRLCVAILWRLCFLPFGIIFAILVVLMCIFGVQR